MFPAHKKPRLFSSSRGFYRSIINGLQNSFHYHYTAGIAVGRDAGHML